MCVIASLRSLVLQVTICPKIFWIRHWAQPQLAQKFKILKVSNYFLYIQKCTCQEQKKKKKRNNVFFLNPSWSSHLERMSQKLDSYIIFTVNKQPLIFLWSKSARLTAQTALNLSLETLCFVHYNVWTRY